MKQTLFKYTSLLFTVTPAAYGIAMHGSRIISDSDRLKSPNFSKELGNFAEQNFPYIRLSKFAPSAQEAEEQKHNVALRVKGI